MHPRGFRGWEVLARRMLVCEKLPDAYRARVVREMMKHDMPSILRTVTTRKEVLERDGYPVSRIGAAVDLGYYSPEEIEAAIAAGHLVVDEARAKKEAQGKRK